MIDDRRPPVGPSAGRWLRRASRTRLAACGALLLLVHALQAAIVVPCLCAMTPASMGADEHEHAHGQTGVGVAHDGHGGHRTTESLASTCRCNHTLRAVITALLGAVGIPRAPVAAEAAFLHDGTIDVAISSPLAAPGPPLSPPPRA